MISARDDVTLTNHNQPTLLSLATTDAGEAKPDKRKLLLRAKEP